MNAQATPIATGTLAKRFVALYLVKSEQFAESAAELRYMFTTTTHQPCSDALFDGYIALVEKSAQFTRHLRDCGGLLFAGSAQALATATLIEAQA